MINEKQGSTTEKPAIYKTSFPQKVGVLLLITFSLLTSIKLLTHEFNFRNVVIGQDFVSRYENRFSGLKKMLSGEEAVGYVTDKAQVEKYTDAYARQEYYLTQYAICPIVVDIKKRNGFIVGNFHPDWLKKNVNYGKPVLIKDFGNGVVLLKGAEEPK